MSECDHTWFNRLVTGIPYRHCYDCGRLECFDGHYWVEYTWSVDAKERIIRNWFPNNFLNAGICPYKKICATYHYLYKSGKREFIRDVCLLGGRHSRCLAFIDFQENRDYLNWDSNYVFWIGVREK